MSEPSPLLGMAIGEAMGIPFEDHTADSPKLQNWVSGSVGSGNWGSATKMATLLARNLVNDGTYNPVTTISDYVEWYKGGDIRDVGSTIKSALDRVLWGYHWNASGIEHTKGHGAALRSAPIGLFFRADYITTMDMARCDARLTHKDVEAETKAMAIALGVALLAEGMNPEQSLKSLMQLLPESEFRNSLENPKPTPSDPMLTAFSCLLTSGSYYEAVSKAIKVGGKTSAAGALTGALAGTRFLSQELDLEPQIEEHEGIRHLDHLLYVSAPKIDPVT